MPNFVVNKTEVGLRLDKAISARFPTHSRATWQQLIKTGEVTVNGIRTEPRFTLRGGEAIEYPEIEQNPVWQPPLLKDAEHQNLEILYEDRQVLVINKPFGLITHPAHAHTDDSVVHRIINHDHSISSAVYDPQNLISTMRPGIVHRLDKDTSGVMIIAKTKDAMSFLAKQIQNRRVTKMYHALVWGHVEQSPLELNTWLNRDKSDRRKMAVSEPDRGREATTIFSIVHLLESPKGERATLLEAKPITGRTHQIRVHASHIGHPILGDEVYGSHESKLLSEHIGLKRQFLHAHSLTILLPSTNKTQTFTAPLPPDLQKALDYFK